MNAEHLTTVIFAVIARPSEHGGGLDAGSTLLARGRLIAAKQSRSCADAVAASQKLIDITGGMNEP